MFPGMIFVFLKYAGKNEFNIPVYYEQGVEAPPSGCDLAYQKPYLIPEGFRDIAGPGFAANLLIFPNVGLDVKKIHADIKNEFGDSALWIRDAHDLFQDSTAYRQKKKCVFLVNDPWQSVLFDSLGRIRGYYNLRLREEGDRLRVELKILQKKY